MQRSSLPTYISFEPGGGPGSPLRLQGVEVLPTSAHDARAALRGDRRMPFMWTSAAARRCPSVIPFFLFYLVHSGGRKWVRPAPNEQLNRRRTRSS